MLFYGNSRNKLDFASTFWILGDITAAHKKNCPKQIITKLKLYSNFCKEKSQQDIVKSLDTKKGEEFGTRVYLSQLQ